MSTDHSPADEEWWPYKGDPIEPTDEHALGAIRSRYREAAKRDKSRMLDEFVAIAGCHRKHAVRLLAHCEEGADRALPRGRRIYDEAVRQALIVYRKPESTGRRPASSHRAPAGSRAYEWRRMGRPADRAPGQSPRPGGVDVDDERAFPGWPATWRASGGASFAEELTGHGV